MESMKEKLQLFVDDSNYFNNLVLGSLLPGMVWQPLPHFFQIWLRNYVAVVTLYFIIGVIWAFYIYHWKRNVCVPEDKIPSNKTMQKHIWKSMKSLPWYSLLPSFSEYMSEKGWTMCFARINDVGLIAYFGYTVLYLVAVEFANYWIHRILHDVKPLYELIHTYHHSYNKEILMSPFLGMAFDPWDGIMQGIQHGIVVFIVPIHYTTYLVLLFSEAIWTANIHDNVDANMWPLMGAGFHTVHHRKNKYNYGHYTVLADWMFGTLYYPSQMGSEKKVM